MTRQHPTFKVDDFLIVEDTRTRRIISSLCLISQTWSYGGVEFGFGLPELVGTDPAYRRRGLVRRQFDVIHRWSAERGQLVQAISGIPWFYRQFGYEMTLEHNTGRVLARFEVPKLADGKTEPYHVRPATPEDVPFIAEVDRQSRDRYLVTAVRDETLWRLELDGRHERFGPRLAIVQSAVAIRSALWSTHPCGGAIDSSSTRRAAARCILAGRDANRVALSGPARRRPADPQG